MCNVPHGLMWFCNHSNRVPSPIQSVFSAATECGLFKPDEDPTKGRWLEMGRTLEYYHLKNGVRGGGKRGRGKGGKMGREGKWVGMGGRENGDEGDLGKKGKRGGRRGGRVERCRESEGVGVIIICYLAGHSEWFV